MPKLILIIDNEIDIIHFLKDRLEEIGYEISTAGNGEEGLKIIETQRIDGIILDLEMPIMDGLTMIKHLQKRLDRIPIIVMSADPTGSLMIEAIKKGAQDYLFKPISSVALTTKCRQLFD